MSQKADLTEKNAELREEAAALKRQLAQRDELTFEENIYWKHKQDGTREGPFCPACAESLLECSARDRRWGRFWNMDERWGGSSRSGRLSSDCKVIQGEALER